MIAYIYLKHLKMNVVYIYIYIYIYDEACEYLGNQGYKIIYEENINNYTEEEQIKIFNEHRQEQEIIMYQLLNALECLDKEIVEEGLKEKEYEFIK